MSEPLPESPASAPTSTAPTAEAVQPAPATPGPSPESSFARALRHWIRSEGSVTLERGAPHRHPADLTRVAIGVIGLVVVALFARRATISVLEQDVFRLVNDLPPEIEPPLSIVMQVGNVVVALLIVAIALALRKVAAGRDMALSIGVAWLAAKALKVAINRPRPSGALLDVVIRAPATGLGFPSGHTAVAAALAAALSPYVTRPVRRAMWAGVFVVALARMYVGAHLPLDVVGGWLLGWAIGSAVHVIFGSPSWVVAASAVVSRLERIGFEPADVRSLHVDARGSTPFFVRDGSGRRLFIKALSRDQRDADWLFKASRFLLFRNVEDESPFATPKQQLEHEAYVQMLAHRAGARVPAIHEVATIDRHEAMLVMDAVDDAGDGESAQMLGEDVLDDIWRQLAILQRHRIAHRDLRSANVMIDTDGAPWLVDFGFAEASASDRRMAVDVAELLVSLAVHVGAERSLQPALRHVDRRILQMCPPLLQKAALSAATRHALRRNPELLPALRSQLSAALGLAEEPPPEPLLRVRVRTVLFVLAAGFAIHVFLPMVGELPQTFDALRSTRPEWILVTVVASALTYVGAALSLQAACPIDLPYLRTLAVTSAASFTNRLAPSGLGRAGLDVRYVERHGATRATALATETLNALGGSVVHVTALVIAVLLFGGSFAGRFRLPSEVVIVVVVLFALVSAGLVAIVGPWRRRSIATLEEAWAAFRTEAQHPRRLVQLFAGAALLNTGYILALEASLRAVGESPGAGTVTLVYLGGAIVAAASPTPGGLGAAEAAYVAGLTAAGVTPSIAIAGVLVFRLFTFWLPTLPGWFAFRWLRRREYV